MKKLEIVSDFISRVDLEEYYDIAEIAENIVTLCDLDFDEHQTNTLAAALDTVIKAGEAVYGTSTDVKQIVNSVIDGDYYLYEDVHDHEELGEELLFDRLQDDGFLEHLSQFIDYDRYGFVYCNNHTCYFTAYGVLEVF